MRIPLDHYRILGLPIQATDEQLKQAHRDRTLQLPRREFSGVAIESRKQLIDEAYNILSNPSKRKDYDAHFLASTYSLESPAATSSPVPETAQANGVEPLAEVNTEVGEEALRSLASDTVTDAYTPTIDIDDHQLVGALLILLELGEYELAIRLGRPYISSGSNTLDSGKFGDPAVVLSDVVLILSLSCLELGREQWQQRQYESAAESLETGRELLLREGLFPAIRNEIQTDLYKLRPYRTLELVALPLNRNRERRQGIQLLKTMLQDRGGIDGTEDDLSGLSIDDFLRFVQQLRGYLTSAEQQELFEVEARRPSAVGIYLTIYAAMARGFAHHQPAFIRRAKKLLKRLGSRQDVHLEQAVCALLLGQTEEASRALELSQEYQPLAFIRENSKGSPDLLPGLCLYAERWLKQEVFPHFRDLNQYKATLKDYFADDQVQTYLESMPMEPDSTEPWVSMPSPSSTGNLSQDSASYSSASNNGHGPPPEQQINPPTFSKPIAPSSPFQAPQPITPRAVVPPRSSGEFVAGDTTSSIPSPVPPAEQVPESALGRSPQSFSRPMTSAAERISQLSPEGSLRPAKGIAGRDQLESHTSQAKTSSASNAADATEMAALHPSARARRQSSPNWTNLAIVALVGILGMGILGFVSMRVLGWIGGLFGGPRLQGVPLALTLDQPPIPIPSAEEIAAETPGVTDVARSTLQKWLDAKAAAMGQSHQIERLDAALGAEQLAAWQKRAQDAQDNNWHWEYEHDLEIQSVTPDNPDANALSVRAQVREKAEFYEQGRLNPASSYEETLQMQYELVLNEGEWRIQSAQKLN